MVCAPNKPTSTGSKSALFFLYKEVLGIELPWLDNVTQAKTPTRLPVVLTEAEVRAVLGALSGIHWIVASLLYGSGLRLMEALRLRVEQPRHPPIPDSLKPLAL